MKNEELTEIAEMVIYAVYAHEFHNLCTGTHAENLTQAIKFYHQDPRFNRHCKHLITIKSYYAANVFEPIIGRLIERANHYCDAMEGADGREFTEAERLVNLTLDDLKVLGVCYDPITRMRKDI